MSFVKLPWSSFKYNFHSTAYLNPLCWNVSNFSETCLEGFAQIESTRPLWNKFKRRTQENNHHHSSLKMKIELYLKYCSPNFRLFAPKAVPYTIITNISPAYKTAFFQNCQKYVYLNSKIVLQAVLTLYWWSGCGGEWG